MSVYFIFKFYALLYFRSKDPRYDDAHLESNNNKPMDKPLNLETEKRERRFSNDKDSGTFLFLYLTDTCELFVSPVINRTLHYGKYISRAKGNPLSEETEEQKTD